MDWERENLRQIYALNQRGGRTLSIVDLMNAGTVSAEVAALCWLLVERGESFLTGAGPGGAGKTALMASLLAFLPRGEKVFTISDYSVIQAALAGELPEPYCLMPHEIGSGHWYGYIWGGAVRDFLDVCGPGRRCVSCLHADTVDEARDILRSCAAHEQAINRVTLMLFICAEGGRLRRIHRLTALDFSLDGEMRVLYRWDRDEDRFAAEVDRRKVCRSLGTRYGAGPEKLFAEWDARAAFLTQLQAEGVVEYENVRARVLQETRKGETT